jgi:hypothetical protein
LSCHLEVGGMSLSGETAGWARIEIARICCDFVEVD